MITDLQDWEEISYTLILNAVGEFLNSFFLSLLQYLIDTVEHLILGFLLYIIICILMYLFMVTCKCLSFNHDVRNSKRVLFVIAHPDDECMFFGPTILNYTRKKDCIVYLMCLTTGRNNGMGSTRKLELYESCKILGIQESNIFIHNHTYLPDAMDVSWPTEVVSNLISTLVDSLSITTLITFDRYGVSYHNNHSSIYYAVASLIVDGELPKCVPYIYVPGGITLLFIISNILLGCGVYVLETTNLIRKYWLLLDLPVSFVWARFRYSGGFQDRAIIHKAMIQHRSQLVWFRRLYMYFSRYMLMNTLQQMNLVDIELDLELED